MKVILVLTNGPFGKFLNVIFAENVLADLTIFETRVTMHSLPVRLEIFLNCTMIRIYQLELAESKGSIRAS